MSGITLLSCAKNDSRVVTSDFKGVNGMILLDLGLMVLMVFIVVFECVLLFLIMQFFMNQTFDVPKILVLLVVNREKDESGLPRTIQKVVRLSRIFGARSGLLIRIWRRLWLLLIKISLNTITESWTKVLVPNVKALSSLRVWNLRVLGRLPIFRVRRREAFSLFNLWFSSFNLDIWLRSIVFCSVNVFMVVWDLLITDWFWACKWRCAFRW